MKLALEKVESLCEERGYVVAHLLRESGVSRNSYYSLARKKYVVPDSLVKIAAQLDVPVSELLEDVQSPALRMKRLIAELKRITAKDDRLDPDNVRHTLLLLEEKPIERLRRALRRGRPTHLR